MNTSLASNDPSQRTWAKLETLSFNIENSYQQLHEGVKHYFYEKIEEYSAKFTKDVMAYINEMRHLKEKMNGASKSQDVKKIFQEKIVYLNHIEAYIDNLKKLSKSYKKNDVFKHTPELRQLMETEDVRMIELEQAINSVKGLML